MANDARVFTPSAPKLRKVLALLLLNANHLVPVSTFLEELWGENPPPSALTTLQTYIYHLRKIFDEGPRTNTDAFLVTRPAGYLARVRPGELDVPLFVERLEQSRTAAEAGNPEEVSRILREALMLWRGPALVDVPKGRILEANAIFLEESRITALERRIDADLTLGWHGELIGELRSLVVAYPLRERFYAQLMQALSRSGRRSEALQIYHTLRCVLVEELGLEPSQEVQELQQSVLNADGAFIPQHRSTAWASTSGIATPAQLPPDIADFTGREEQLQQLNRRLSRDPSRPHQTMSAMVVTGPPGVGKTAFALRTAHLMRGELSDGQLYADLGRDSVDVADVLASFLRALGVPNDQIPAGAMERSQLFRTRTADRKLLLVLDNASSTRQVQPLLPGDPQCAVLITSWRRLRGLAGAGVIELGPFEIDEGVQFLAALIGGSRVSAEPDAAKTVVQQCERLPLAIRAAGAKLDARPTWTLSRLADRLADPIWRLNELSTGDVDVQASVEAAYRCVGAREQRAFRLFSLLNVADTGTRTRAALLDTDVKDAATLTENLEEAYLVDVEEAAEGSDQCCRFNDLFRAFARTRLECQETPSDIQAALERIGRGWFAWQPGPLVST